MSESIDITDVHEALEALGGRPDPYVPEGEGFTIEDICKEKPCNPDWAYKLVRREPRIKRIGHRLNADGHRVAVYVLKGGKA